MILFKVPSRDSVPWDEDTVIPLKNSVPWRSDTVIPLKDNTFFLDGSHQNENHKIWRDRYHVTLAGVERTNKWVSPAAELVTMDPAIQEGTYDWRPKKLQRRKHLTVLSARNAIKIATEVLTTDIYSNRINHVTLISPKLCETILNRVTDEIGFVLINCDDWAVVWFMPPDIKKEVSERDNHVGCFSWDLMTCCLAYENNVAIIDDPF